MGSSRCVACGLLVAAVLATLVTVGRSPLADDPPKKPLSTEDENRELKRRADMADQRYAEQVATNKELREALAETGRNLNDEANARARSLKSVNDRVDGVANQAVLDRVPLGAMIPYFGTGDTPPKGYVWADGKSNWPKAVWVPGHLSGKPVPNLNDLPLIGTENLAQVGEEVASRKVTGSGTVNPAGLTIALAGKEGWAVNKGRGDKSWLWVPKQGIAIEVADPGGKIDNAWLHSFLEPNGAQNVGGTAGATFEASLTRGNIPGVRSRWIIRVE